jgi:hypothetical protein
LVSEAVQVGRQRCKLDSLCWIAYHCNVALEYYVENGTRVVSGQIHFGGKAMKVFGVGLISLVMILAVGYMIGVLYPGIGKKVLPV